MNQEKIAAKKHRPPIKYLVFSIFFCVIIYKLLKEGKSMAEKVISFLKNTLSIPFMILGFMASDLMLRMMTQEVGFYDIHHSAPFLFTLFWSCMLALIFTSFPRRFGQILYGIVSLVFMKPKIELCTMLYHRFIKR